MQFANQSFSLRCMLPVLLMVCTISSRAQQKDIAYYAAKAPFAMPAVETPVFKNNSFSIADFGGVNDGKTLNTTAFAKAIEACCKAGGGRVLVPAGTWLTGPVELKSNIELHVEKNAIIQFTTDHTQFPMIRMNNDNSTPVTASPLYAYNAKNIAITGEGTIDGAGDSWRPVKKSKVAASLWEQLIKTGAVSSDGKIWWPSNEAMTGEAYVKKIKDKPGVTPQDYEPARDFLRPYMLYLVRCDKILIQGVTLRNSPKFVFYPSRCTNLTMDGVNVFNDWWAQNGDGIDISACNNVVIYKCTVSVGDDGICMKSSRGSSAPGEANLRNVLIAACTVFRAHGGFVIGSNTDGGMENIFVTDCNFIGSDIGIRVKSNAGRGGLVHNIYIDSINMKSIREEAILFTTYYEDMPAGKTAKDVVESPDDKIPHFTGFHISNITCEGAATAISITGDPAAPVTDIHFTNLQLTTKKGFVATDAKDIYLQQVTINAAEPLYKIRSSANIVVDGKVIE